jgi:hypothetical protein
MKKHDSSRKNIVICLSLFLACASSAQALETITAHVTALEASYLPSMVTFWLDAGSHSCPVGTMLKWSKPDPDNNKAVYSTLLTALTAGNSVRFYINDGDTQCVGQFIHLLAK